MGVDGGYSSGVEAVSLSVGGGFNCLPEGSGLIRVCMVLTDAFGFFLQPCSINSVQCRTLYPSDALGCFTHM